MKTRFIILFRLAIFWLLFFVIARITFIIYNIVQTEEISFIELLKTFYYGILLDISITGYILFFGTLLLLICSWASVTIQKNTLKIYSLILFFGAVLITVIDVELYRNWGFRIDNTVLLYIKTPKESLASTRLYVLLILLGLIITLIGIGIKLYQKFFAKIFLKVKPIKIWHIPVILIFMGALIIPIRGGIGIAPINQGRVYFSEHTFANHSALNVVWNFMQSVTTSNKAVKVSFMTDAQAAVVFDALHAKRDSSDQIKLIGKAQPNIVIIILESFSSNLLMPLGGIYDVTPGLNQMCKRGVFFTDFYANGDRSDKGLVAVLSGYPAQPTTSIIKNVNKTAKLPHLSRDLEAMGYHTGFYYGGDINFANMNSYFISGGYDTMVTLHKFSKQDFNSKWGAHDHIVFDRLFTDLNQSSTPFFRVMFTLSSHDPYDVPYKSRFLGIDDESRFLNSVAYTDSCLTDFINRAQKTEWWDNTWIILMADHGSRYPGNISYFTPKKFAIPMLWTGGAIVTDTVIKSTLMQTDIPLMINHQLGNTSSNYPFSKDILKGDSPFAFYAFNNGFGFIKDKQSVIFDITSNKTIEQTQENDTLLTQGKSFLQVLLNDFNSK